MPATELWSSTEAVNGYIRLAGNIRTGAVTGVKCVDAIDVSNYDNENYRDEFFSSSGGVTVQLVGANPFTPEDGDYLTATTEAGVETQATLTASGAGVTVLSAPDAAMHIPPRNEVKKRTMLRFWTGAFSGGTGTGNVVAACWADEFMGFSPTTLSFI